jgi:membrane dipeptidase
LRWSVAAAAVVAGLPDGLNWATSASAAEADPVEIVMDGHVHITNRIYWEGIDPWIPTKQGWDFARARSAGVNCIIDNIGPYGYWNYNYTPKQALRLIDTLLRFSEAHADKMAIALSPADARRIVGSGRMAVFIGCESGFDHEGDPDVLDAFYRLGLRTVQFATQTGFNAFSDSALAATQGGEKPDHFGGINDHGRKLVAQMNELGILIDIAHGTEAVQAQLIQSSRAPVVASHETVKAVSGAGLSDDVLKALANKGGVVGIHGAAAVVGKRYRQWMASNPAGAANSGKAVSGISHLSRGRRATMASSSNAWTGSFVSAGSRWRTGKKTQRRYLRCRRRMNGPSMSTTSSGWLVQIMSPSASTWLPVEAPFPPILPAIRI